MISEIHHSYIPYCMYVNAKLGRTMPLHLHFAQWNMFNYCIQLCYNILNTVSSNKTSFSWSGRAVHKGGKTSSSFGGPSCYGGPRRPAIITFILNIRVIIYKAIHYLFTYLYNITKNAIPYSLRKLYKMKNSSSVLNIKSPPQTARHEAFVNQLHADAGVNFLAVSWPAHKSRWKREEDYIGNWALHPDFNVLTNRCQRLVK